MQKKRNTWASCWLEFNFWIDSRLMQMRRKIRQKLQNFIWWCLRREILSTYRVDTYNLRYKIVYTKLYFSVFNRLQFSLEFWAIAGCLKLLEKMLDEYPKLNFLLDYLDYSMTSLLQCVGTRYYKTLNTDVCTYFALPVQNADIKIKEENVTHNIKTKPEGQKQWLLLIYLLKFSRWACLLLSLGFQLWILNICFLPDNSESHLP